MNFYDVLKRGGRGPNASTYTFATVGAVYSDGVTLILDGETTATNKHYKHNAALSLSAGQRVKVLKVDGTYVVEYKI